MVEILNDIIDSYNEEIVSNLQELIKIKSVDAPAVNNMPFGEGIQEALNFIMKLADEKGFDYINFDNYACEISLGSGKDAIGIALHIDVVPEGDGWSFDPYGAEISQGRIYGRGAVDDKGPLIAAFYACLAIKESGLQINKRIKQIIGTNEESTEFKCIKHYKKHGDVPEKGIVADSWFPVAYAEKGIYNYKYKMIIPKEETEDLKLLEINGGEAFNIVAPSSFAILKCNAQGERLIKDVLEGFQAKDRIRFEKNGRNIKLEVVGKPAHASVPEQGINSISILLKFLESVWKKANLHNSTLTIVPESLFVAIHKIVKQMCMDTDGTGLGIAYADHTGELTNNLGLISYDNGALSLTMNIRSPITMDIDILEAKLKDKAKEAGVEFCYIDYNPYYYVDPESDTVRTLTDIYREMTGDLTSKPKAHGGGSYARILPGFIPMGPHVQGEMPTFHKQDEYIECGRLIQITKIYAQVLYQMAL